MAKKPSNLVLSNSSLASSDYRSLSEEEQRRRNESKKEREARSLALEKAYVHDVYEQISANFSDSRYRPWPRVKQFLMDLEPGAFVCDVGKKSSDFSHQIVRKFPLPPCPTLIIATCCVVKFDQSFHY